MKAKVSVSKDKKIVVSEQVLNELGLKSGDVVELEIARQGHSPSPALSKRAAKEALLREWIFNDEPENA